MHPPTRADLIGRAHERFFPAMGTSCHVVVVGPMALLDRAEDRVAHLERCWSRFLPDSDVSRLNEADGEPLVVGRETYLLIRRAVDAWRATDGWFDPTVLRSLRSLGYDRSFHDPASGVHRTDGGIGRTAPAPGAQQVELDAARGTVALPRGVLFDPGGIGKGLAADLVATELVAAGAEGACVNLGGDLRAAGRPPSAAGWHVGVADPVRPDHVVPLGLAEGAVATSTRRTRTWARSGRRYHHLIDPRTGLPSTSDVHTVTVVGAEAWWAEVLAKVLLLVDMPEAAAVVANAGVAALVATESAGAYELGPWHRQLVSPG